jgi:hypothetical protein
LCRPSIGELAVQASYTTDSDSAAGVFHSFTISRSNGSYEASSIIIESGSARIVEEGTCTRGRAANAF